jgi:hypothetical protein
MLRQAYPISARKEFTFCLNFADQQGQHFVVGGVGEHIKQLDPLNAIARRRAISFAMVRALQLE